MLLLLLHQLCRCLRVLLLHCARTPLGTASLGTYSTVRKRPNEETPSYVQADLPL